MCEQLSIIALRGIEQNLKWFRPLPEKISRNRVFFCCPYAATQGKTFQRLPFWVKPRVPNAQMVFSSEKVKNHIKKHTKIKRERSENDSSNAKITQNCLRIRHKYYDNELPLALTHPICTSHKAQARLITKQKLTNSTALQPTCRPSPDLWRQVRV